MRKVLFVFLTFYLVIIGWSVSWAVNETPQPGSIWTWLGPTFGADWVAPPIPTDALSYGAVCDGVTDDSAQINAALVKIAGGPPGGVLNLPPGRTCKVYSTIKIPAAGYTKIMGHGFSSVLEAGTANIPVVEIQGNHTGLESLSINCSVPGSANTSGNCINVDPFLFEVLIRDFKLNNPFTGIATTTSVLVNIQDGYIYAPTPTTGRCVLVNGGNNQVIRNLFCEGQSQTQQPQFGIEIQSTGGIWLDNNQTLWGGNGEYIDPGSGQSVTWVFESQSAYDSGSQNGISIVPTGSGSVRGYFCTGCWTATNSLNGVVIGTGAGTVDDAHFVAHRSYNNQQHGFAIEPPATNVFIDGASSICGNSASGAGAYNGVEIGPVAHVSILGSRIGNCAGFQGFQLHGINAEDGAAFIDIMGDNLTGNTDTPLNLLFSNSTIANIEHNVGVDDQVPLVASGTTITLPPNPFVALSGSTPIKNILGGWQSRRVTFVQGTNQTFQTGGTSGQDIATGMVTNSPIPNTAYLLGPHWYIR